MSGEELAASLFGKRTDARGGTADPLDVPWAWRMYAYRGYLLLQSLDRSLRSHARRRRSSTTCSSRRPRPRAASHERLLARLGHRRRTASSCAAKARPRKSAIDVQKVQRSTPMVPAIGPYVAPNESVASM